MQYGKGELEFESYMRMLDDKGVNTGYPYKVLNIFKGQIPTYSAVQYPPIVPGMEGPPSDTDRSRTSTSQRSAWFTNTKVIEQRISPPSDRKVFGYAKSPECVVDRKQMTLTMLHKKFYTTDRQTD